MKKMAKIICGIALLSIAAYTVYAAVGATLGTQFTNVGAKTISTQYPGARTGSWQLLDSAIVVNDSSTAAITITGLASLDPGDHLYIGISQTAVTTTPKDTTTAGEPLFHVYRSLSERGPSLVPFTYRYCIKTTAVNTDTLYFVATCGGSTVQEQVPLSNVYTTVNVSLNK